MRERNRFLRGMTVWVGFNQTAVTYRRAARTARPDEVHAGKMLRFAFDAIELSRTPRCRPRRCSASRSRSLGFLRSRWRSSPATPTSTSRGVPTTIVIILLLSAGSS